MKPHIFVGSATESLDIAMLVHEVLEQQAEVTVWSEDLFAPSKYVLESLLDALEEADCAAFVLAPNDVLLMRGTEQSVTRDNVVFELGLFMGKLGRHRTFMLLPSGATDFHIPSDLLGVTPIYYDGERLTKNPVAAVAPACARLMRAVKKLGPAPQTNSSMLQEFSRLAPKASVEFLRRATSDAYIVGVSLRTLVSHFEQRPSSEYRQPVADLVHSGVHFRFLFLDPESEIAEEYASDRHEPNLVEQISTSIDILARFKESLESIEAKGRFEGFAYNHFPSFYMMMIDPDGDGQVIISPYLHAIRRSESPYMVATKSSSPLTFGTHEKAMRSLLKSARPLF